MLTLNCVGNNSSISEAHLLYTKLRDFKDGTRNAGGNDSAVPLGLPE